MFRYIALIVIPSLVFACCPPSKWEGTQYVAIGSTEKDGTSHYTEIKQNVTVDSDMRRTFISQALLYDGHGMMQDILQDFGSGEQYVTTYAEDGSVSCERMAIESVEPGCIPKNSTKIIQSYFGAGNAKINATMYQIHIGQSTVYATMSDDGCIPLAYEASGLDKNGAGYQMTVEFFHITPGVADTSLFKTPTNSILVIVLGFDSDFPQYVNCEERKNCKLFEGKQADYYTIVTDDASNIEIYVLPNERGMDQIN